jgi:hypothetical protein
MKYLAPCIVGSLALVSAVFLWMPPVLAQVSEEPLQPKSVAVEQVSYSLEELPSAGVYRDFVVGPGKFELELAPGESKKVELVVSNRMGEKKRFSLTAEDMTGSSDPTQAVNLLGEERGPYTLKDFISVPHAEFELEHGMRARIPVTVSLPVDAEPGGRYGSLLVSIVSRSEDGSVPKDSTTPGSVIISRIGTLFFVTNPGEVTQDVSLVDFDVADGKHFLTKGPVSFSIVSENKGSVHATPYGEVRIYNMFDHEVGFVELDPWFVMPKSLRLREVAWNSEFLFGKYTAVTKINRGYDDIVDEQSVVFYAVPIRVIVGVFGTLFVLFFILYFVRSRFEFRRKER